MATNTKLETIIKGAAKGNSFVLSLDSYTKINYEKNGNARLFATTVRGVEIPLTMPIDPRDQRLEHDKQSSFLDSLYVARESSGKQLEWALRFGEYTKDKSIIHTLLNFFTLGSISNRENEVLDSMAKSYLAWSIINETAETLARIPQIAKFSEFYEEITKISKPIAKKMHADYLQISSMKGFADSVYKGDLDMYKVSLLLAAREKKKTQMLK